MGSSRENAERYWLDPAENERIFRQQILRVEYGRLQPVASPSLHYFAAQPGAGKSYLQDEIVGDLRDRSGHDTVMQIIGDDLRPYHPAYAELLEGDDQLAAFYTDHDSGLWVEQAIIFSLTQRSHVALEGTLRRAQVVTSTVERYKQAGFTRHLHVLAIHAFVSRARIIGRYLSQVASESHGRYTTTEAHDAAYNVLPGSLASVARSRLFDTISLYSGNGEPLTTVDAKTPDPEKQLLAVLNHERAVPQIPPGILLNQLDTYQNLAARYERHRCLNDIRKLQDDLRASR